MPHKARYQFDLFTHPQNAEWRQTPQWLALPEETRQVLAKMMACLILDHACADNAAQERKQRIGRDA